MKAPALNYGRMRRPEESQPPQSFDNPVQAVMAAYQQWLQLAYQVTSRETLDVFFVEQREECKLLYSEAVALLERIEPLRRIGNSELESIIAGINPDVDDHHVASGLFVSAAFNLSDVTSLEGNFHYNIIGYRLPAGKKITLGPKSAAIGLGGINFGTYAEGTTINKCGDINNMAAFASGGLHINMGEARQLGFNAGNSVFVNLRRVRDSVAALDDSCLAANLWLCDAFAVYDSRNTIKLDFRRHGYGKAPARFADDVVLVKRGHHGLYITMKQYADTGLSIQNIAGSRYHAQVFEIIELVTPIKALSSFKDDEKKLDAALSIDWEAARKRLIEISTEIKV